MIFDFTMFKIYNYIESTTKAEQDILSLVSCVFMQNYVNQVHDIHFYSAIHTHVHVHCNGSNIEMHNLRTILTSQHNYYYVHVLGSPS